MPDFPKPRSFSYLAHLLFQWGFELCPYYVLDLKSTKQRIGTEIRTNEEEFVA